MQPLILNAAGAALSPLQPWEYPENVGVELEEIFELPLEEAEVSKQPLEEVSGEVLGWKEYAVVTTWY